MASEAMKVKLVAGITNSENTMLTVASGHTYTVLNLSLCETAGAAETFDLYVDDNGGGTDFEIYSDQALAANSTFEHTTRLVLEAGDILCCALASAGNVDCVISYLDQTL